MVLFKPQYGNGIKITPLLGVLHALRMYIYAHKMGGGGDRVYYPWAFLALFGHFGPKWPKPANSWGPLGVQGIEEKRNLLLG